jgi:hypothetical protein
MKLLFSITLLLSATLISCGNSKPLVGTLDDSVTDEIVQENITSGEVSLKLYSKSKLDTVESAIGYMFYTDPKLPYQDSINRMIKMFISGVVSNGGGATDQNANLSEAYIEEALGKFGKEYNRQLEFIDDGMVWSTETSIGITEGKPGYVEVLLSNWSFSGGAHGNAWSEESVFDIKTGRELLLSDFITDVDELTTIAEAIFRADQEILPDTDLMEAGFWFKEDVFSLNENFVFNEESLSFIYNSYEVAPYVFGMITINIPRDQIKHLLKRKVD